MKYNYTAKLMMFFLKMPIYKAIKKRTPAIYTDSYKKKVKEEYQSIIERTEGVGGKENPMEIILYFFAFLIAIYKSADGKMSEKDFEFIVDALGESSIMKVSSKLSGAFSTRNITTYQNLARMSKEQKYKNNWVMTFNYDKKNEEYFMNYTQCALCKVGKAEGVFSIVKYLCKIDYYMYKYKNVVLDRTKTLAYGNDCCNFHVMSKKRAKETNFTQHKDAK